MNVRIVCFFAVLILGISLSFQHNDYESDKAAKKAWKQARKEGKAAESNMMLVITPDGKEIGYRQYSYSIQCKQGYTVEKLLADGASTCKKAPGRGRRMKCVNVYGSMHGIYCPDHMYINSFWDEGTTEKLKCCGERNLKYSDEDCTINIQSVGVDFETVKGKFWTGFSTTQGGVSWNITQCGFKSSYRY